MFFLARVRAGRSSLCIGLGFRSRRERNVRKGGAKFFVFWLPRVKAFSSKFLDKKRDTPREKEERNGERERERFCILCWCFLLWECFSLFFFVRCVFFDVVCSPSGFFLRVQKIVVVVAVVLHY